jgi:hypothetical protein
MPTRFIRREPSKYLNQLNERNTLQKVKDIHICAIPVENRDIGRPHAIKRQGNLVYPSIVIGVPAESVVSPPLKIRSKN